MSDKDKHTPEFKDGLELWQVIGMPDANGDRLRCTVGRLGCARIVVSMEPGLMQWAPWARVEIDTHGKQRELLVNLSLMESVEILNHQGRETE